MFIYVKLLHGFSQPLLYKVPAEFVPAMQLGLLVRVPIKNQQKSAIVIALQTSIPTSSFIIKDITGIEPFPSDIYYQSFIDQLSSYYQIDPLYFFKRIRHFLTEEVLDQPPLTHEAHEEKKVLLTAEQQEVINFIAPSIAKPTFTPVLLHGLTGSGKTEVYKKLIVQAIEEQKTAILLLPEVTLALQFQKLLLKQLPHISLHGFHSGISSKDKKILWQRLLTQEPMLIIGVHLPVLLPIANLGLIIIDEEHEIGYQEKKHPKINSKEAAIMRAQQAQIPVLLGSATPSLPSLYNVEKRGWQYFKLEQRFSGNLPSIEIIELSDKKQRKNFWISARLQAEIKKRLDAGEQSILFLNRRGYSFFVQCKNCQHIFMCNSCSVSLTLHENDILTCHYCSFQISKPGTCPSCKKTDFLHKGIGTQQLMNIVHKLFPQARIARADLDTTMKKKVWDKTVKDFEQGNLDILIGTQTITKGFHFPNVTLVGIIWADLNVHFPMYNAAETALQQLIQVAGRAGRSSKESLVIVQAISNYPLFNYLDEKLYKEFYQQELMTRTEVGYPPIMRFAELELKHTCETTIEKEAAQLTQFLLTQQTNRNLHATILGPAKPPVHMIKKTHMRKIYIKSSSMDVIHNLVTAIDRDTFTSAIYFTPNPLH